MNDFPFTTKDSLEITQDKDMVFIRPAQMGYMLTEDMLKGLKEFIFSYPEKDIEIGKDYIKINKAKWL